MTAIFIAIALLLCAAIAASLALLGWLAWDRRSVENSRRTRNRRAIAATVDHIAACCRAAAALPSGEESSLLGQAQSLADARAVLDRFAAASVGPGDWGGVIAGRQLARDVRRILLAMAARPGRRNRALRAELAALIPAADAVSRHAAHLRERKAHR